MERIWGGRQLEERYGRSLPSPGIPSPGISSPGIPFREAWEIVGRENEQSIVDSGDFSE